MASPVQDYRTIVDDSGNPGYVNRVLIGVPVTGLLRVEWVQARFGQLIPVNWSQVEMFQFLDGYMPLRYQVDDAQNLIIHMALEKQFEWVLLYEHDVIPPPNAFMYINNYMREGKVPIVSGLYFTRALPSEPLIFKGRGNGAYTKFHLGDKVYCDGVPTGFLLVHTSLLRLMYEESEPYDVRQMSGMVTIRRVFNTPRDTWSDPEQTQWYNTTSGTSDLDWCTRVIKGDYLRRSGWTSYVDGLEDQRFPFLVDTNLLCRHINMDGSQYPPQEVINYFMRPQDEQKPPDLGVAVNDGTSTREKLGG